MRKLSVLFMLLIGFAFTNAQSEGSNWLKVGIHAGIPVGDAGDFSSFALGVDAKYQFLDLESFGIGVATGYTNYFGKEMDIAGYKVDMDDFGVVPVAALFRYYPTQNFFVGADLGYGFLVGDNVDGGGFYYRPEVGYHNNDWNIFAYYAGVSDNGSIANAGVGVNYNLIKGK
ncbi:hypothetical protein NMK71_04490 [Weeksellaceae bacterium KMM 9713]|uniref:Outer membrane protein beta-barrel domain-containing protein n=1 Tax=Profundicola chukchiensis TaxID=2961959 RepID=A0A9X4MX85_9FLAO|nr:hypothetical protein [Profundicola chukchiensis]MDG4945664.1 hypothetical protein [Profundicola chukchiensis]